MKDQISFIPGYQYEEPAPVNAGAEARRYKRPVEKYGPGPQGKTCRDCKHLLNRFCTYKKCAEWIKSASSATDIRLKDPACGKFQQVNLEDLKKR